MSNNVVFRKRLAVNGVMLVASVLSLSTYFLAQQGSGLICVAPYPKPVCSGGVCLGGDPEFSCASENVSLKVDSRKPVPWPKKECMSVDGLALDVSHRVVLLCDGKPKQSFKFRFSEVKKNKACLWVNDLYRTVQLWDLDRNAPWCKCKDGDATPVSQPPVQQPTAKRR